MAQPKNSEQTSPQAPPPAQALAEAAILTSGANAGTDALQREYLELVVRRMREEDLQKARAAELDRAARKSNAIAEEMKRLSDLAVQQACSHASELPMNITSIGAQRVSVADDKIRAVCQRCRKIFHAWEDIPINFRNTVAARMGGPQTPGTGGLF